MTGLIETAIIGFEVETSIQFFVHFSGSYKQIIENNFTFTFTLKHFIALSAQKQ